MPCLPQSKVHLEALREPDLRQGDGTQHPGRHARNDLEAPMLGRGRHRDARDEGRKQTSGTVVCDLLFFRDTIDYFFRLW